MSQTFSSLKGDVFLQLGIEEHESWLMTSDIDKKLVCLPFEGKNKASIIASMYELPFETSSVDLIFCPFTLNLLTHRASFLNEVDRILSPNGNIVFCGINPFSLWGLSKYFGCLANEFDLVSVHSIRKDLSSLGYVINEVNRFLYWPPFVKSMLWERIFEKVGQMVLPYPAGFYLLSANKSVYTPILKESPLFYETNIC